MKVVHRSDTLLVVEDRPWFFGLMLIAMALSMIFGGMVMVREGPVWGGAILVLIGGGVPILIAALMVQRVRLTLDRATGTLTRTMRSVRGQAQDSYRQAGGRGGQHRQRGHHVAGRVAIGRPAAGRAFHDLLHQRQAARGDGGCDKRLTGRITPNRWSVTSSLLASGTGSRSCTRSLPTDRPARSLPPWVHGLIFRYRPRPSHWEH